MAVIALVQRSGVKMAILLITAIGTTKTVWPA